MKPQTWLRMEELFHEALEIPPAGREDFLHRSCNGDAALLSELHDLLSAFDDQKLFIPPAASAEPEGRLGENVGGYQLDAEIGQGGMGTVYLAHRTDGEFEQHVALKVVSSHLRTRFFTERFRAERQILANLNHPNITRLLDGGVSTDGDPYLVMEYVEGQPINRYCDERKLPVDDRIRLFLNACSAVEYAHRKLIVHRDLKPGNLLVTNDGVPKLLDFGTAKLTLSAQADHTTTRFQAMTPRYASPEQLRGEPVSTSMDVYSLGVMLHELLVGAWPFGDPNSPIAGLERAMRDIEPAPPRSLVTDESARLRSTSKGKLARVLDGDLRNILRKVLDADPQRRYSSVEHLSDDLKRYLSGEPVLARPGTVLYYSGRFIRRYRLAVSAAVIVAIILAASTVYSFREARAARLEATKSALITEFLRGVLSTADPMDDSGGGKNITVVEALDRSRAQLSQFDSQPQIQGYLNYTLGITFSNLSEYAKAEEHLRNALTFARKLGTDEEVAWAECGVASILMRTGQNWDEAEDLYRDAFERVRKIGRAADPQIVHIAVGQYAMILWKRHGPSPYAEGLAREAIGLARTSRAIAPSWLSLSDYKLAQYLIENNRDAEAEQLLQDGLRVERGFSTPSSSLGPVLATLGLLRLKHGDFAAAEQFERQYRDHAMRKLGPNHVMTVEAQSLWAVSWSILGHNDEALPETAQALDSARKLLPAESPGMWRPLISRAYVLNQANRGKEAEPLARESLECIGGSNSEDESHAASWAELGIALLGQRRWDDARSALETSARIYNQIPGAAPYFVTRVHDAESSAKK